MGQKVINGDLNILGAIKHSGTELNYNGISNNEVISVVNVLPTADASSPDFVQYNNKLYKKSQVFIFNNVTDLTGTSWVVKPIPDTYSTTFQCSINFNTNESTHTTLEIADDELSYDSTTVFNGNSENWSSQTYRLIHIIGGVDVCNSTLINWLQSNATQVFGINLAGAHYKFKDTLDLSYYSWGPDTYNINFQSNGTSYISIYLYSSYVNYNEPSPSVETTVYNSGNNGWINQAYRDVFITGGTDSTEPDLIEWISQNATLQPTYELVEKGIPTVTISLTQVISQDPVEIQLTNEQYDIFASNKQVLIDVDALGMLSTVWVVCYEDSSVLRYGFANGAKIDDFYYSIQIDKSTKIAEYQSGAKNISVDQIGAGNYLDTNKILKMDSQGWGTLSNSLPVITTAPSAANTDGGVILVVLSSEPATKYSGYLYIITGSNS